MIIAIEAQRIFRKHKHGMDNVIIELIARLQKIDKLNQYYIIVAKGEDRSIEETENFKIIELDYSFYPLWEQWALPRAVKKLKADILHCTSNTAPLYQSAKLILTLHDIFFLEPEEQVSKLMYQKMGRYYRRWIVPRILPKCKQVITVSYTEQQRILDRGLVMDDKLSVIYNSYGQEYKVLEHIKKVTSKYTPSENFYLFFGNADPRKNTKRVIEAFCIYLQKSSKKLPLLISVISAESINDILREIDMAHMAKYFVCLNYVPKSDLPFLYNGATAFIIPSLKEGFGIPILEAMACGTPVITSNVSAMPEVAADAAILVDPMKCNNIAEAILNIENNIQIRNQLINSGLHRVKLFSWENSAFKLLNIYNSL